MSIQIFEDINASHAATGFHARTDLPDFHIFTLEETYPDTVKVMTPYSFRFYQVVLLENSADASLNMNAEDVGELSNSLTFASPEHILAWVRGEKQRGFILYFKPDLLASYPVPVIDEFPFFRLTEVNYLQVTGEDKGRLRGQFQQLLTAFNQPHPYRVQILAALLLVLLFECKRLHDAHELTMESVPVKHALTLRFQQFINQHFLTRKTVQDYAELLSVSPDYLGQTVKETTGKTPLVMIAERILLEAKRLLRYSDLNVAEIAEYLGYSEPTHFGRFFRRYAGMTPLAWRNDQS